MAKLTCKMCGGEIVSSPYAKLATCAACRTVQTVPAGEDAQKAARFNRANKLRMDGRFDEAAEAYETLAADYPDDAEGYWGKCLSKCGVVYRDAPGGRKTPVCRRVSFASVTQDPDYGAALSHAEAAARAVYLKQGAEIAAAQRADLEIVRAEQPYDVFLCADKRDGERAGELCRQLTDEGYRVFYEDVTLADKTDAAHEPFVFAALHSAKAMLAVGTSKERFSDAAAKSEWSEFLALTQADSHKLLIPCYQNMRAEELPQALAGLQAQDMSGDDFTMDLLQALTAVLPPKKTLLAAAAREAESYGAPETPYGAPEGQSYGQPYGGQEGQPYAPDPQAYAAPEAQPYGQPYGGQEGQPYAPDPQAYAAPEGQPYGQPYGGQEAQSYGQPYGGQEAQPYAPGYYAQGQPSYYENQGGPAGAYGEQPYAAPEAESLSPDPQAYAGPAQPRFAYGAPVSEGREAPPALPEEPAEKPESGSKKKLIAIVGGIVAALVVIGAVVAVLLVMRSRNTVKLPEPEPSTVQPTTLPPATTEPVTQPVTEATTEAPAPTPEFKPYTDGVPYLSYRDGGSYARQDDETVYRHVLGGFGELLEQAQAAKTAEDRLVLMAQAEAYLLDSAAVQPTTSQGGQYAITHAAPHTVPYLSYSLADRYDRTVLTNELITTADYEALTAQWQKARAGQGTYDPAGYLLAQGYTFNRTCRLGLSDVPETLDPAAAGTADLNFLINAFDGLVRYDFLGNPQPAIASSWDVSADGKTYTFHLRDDVYWVSAAGERIAPVTAWDFVAGFRHALDAQGGYEFIVDNLIVGATDYYMLGGSFDDVGFRAKNDTTLEIRLEAPAPYFLSTLAYPIFLPMNASFYEAHGGDYANVGDPASQLYCGPFLVTACSPETGVTCEANPYYYEKESVTVDSIRWTVDEDLSNEALYSAAVNGERVGVTLTGDLQALAREDGNLEQYGVVTPTNSVTYFSALNVNRGTFRLENGAAPSAKQYDETAKIAAAAALSNRDFRKALTYAFDRTAYNAAYRGEALQSFSLRNMYCAPDLVKLERDVRDEYGFTFKAGASYGDLVQHYLDLLGTGIKVADGQDGWYNPDLARQHLEAAKKALGATVSYPIRIDLVYYSPNATQTAQAEAYKNAIESVLGAENVTVNLIETTESDDYYAASYRAPDGEHGDYDVYAGSGWSPDYTDPWSYLQTFAEGGYMCKAVGINN